MRIMDWYPHLQYCRTPVCHVNMMVIVCRTPVVGWRPLRFRDNLIFIFYFRDNLIFIFYIYAYDIIKDFEGYTNLVRILQPH